MPTRPLPPVVGATENALRSLLTHILAHSAIGGYDEWIYLNIRGATDDPAHIEERVAEALSQPRPIVVAAREQLADAGLLDATGALTRFGHEQLNRGRDLVSEVTHALTADIEPAALQTTIATLDTLRERADQHLHR